MYRVFRYCCIFLCISLTITTMASARSISATETSTLDLTFIHRIEHPLPLADLDWSFDGNFLAGIDQEGTLLLWDAQTWDSLAAVGCSTGHYWELIHGLAWSPQELTLAVGCSEQEGLVKLLLLGSDIQIALLATSTQAVAWSPDGEWLAAGQPDGTIVILNQNFQTVQILGQPFIPAPPEAFEVDSGPGHVFDLTWASDKNYLAVMSIAQGVFVELYDLATKEVIFGVSEGYAGIWEGSSFSVVTTSYGPEADVSQSLGYDGNYPVVRSTRSLPGRFNYHIGNGYLARCEAERLSLFEVDSSTLINPQTESGDPIPCSKNDIVWSSNNLLAIAEDVGGISIWQIKTFN
jgi:WD40 repeat protein